MRTQCLDLVSILQQANRDRIAVSQSTSILTSGKFALVGRQIVDEADKEIRYSQV